MAQGHGSEVTLVSASVPSWGSSKGRVRFFFLCTGSDKLNELKENSVFSGKKNQYFCLLEGVLSAFSSYHFFSGSLFPSQLPNAIKVGPGF